ncbi:MAG: hypothetical protein ACYSX0_17000 [Planctomycetota bacterium]|jgi:hypothetical protein
MDLNPGLERELHKAFKTQLYEDMLFGFSDNRALHATVAFTIQKLMAEDPDFADLETHRDTLVAFVHRLIGERDAFRPYPWCRVPRDLWWQGYVAGMTGGEAKVYFALCALVDPRTLVTCASLETIANMAGRSESRTSRILSRLKRRELIQRWAKKHPDPNDEHHYIWYTRLAPEACCESAEAEEHLMSTAVVPKAG